MKTHKMTGRVCCWAFCVRCGLVALKNVATAAALRAACPGLD